jgi:hypothetical protein
MTTTRIKEKLSTLVLSQLPEFIQSDHSTFVAFLEAYYEFLEQDQNAQELIQNARSYNDIDTTINSFVEYFLKQFSNDIPRSVLADKRALVKRIKDLYENKGNEKSYRLLFRILYNKPIEVFYPSTQILKASDGKWVQETSIFVRTVVGNSELIIGKNVDVISTSSKYPIFIQKKKIAYSSQGASANTFEYVFNNNKNIPITVGDVIEYPGFKGIVVGIPVSATITQRGSGFKVGDILPLTAGLGNGAKLKVTRVDNNGGVVNVQLLSFGLGYTGDFYNFFSSQIGAVSSGSFTFSGGAATVRESLSGFVERGTITTPTYAVTGYFAEDYEGSTISEFFNSTSPSSLSGRPSTTITSSSGLPSDCAIFVRIGSKAFYPGYYQNNDGFLSDDIFLEDETYYQPFTYVIKVEETIENYRKAVLDILHPAGTKLLGELTLGADIDVSFSITAALRYLVSHFQSVAGTNDDGNAKDIFKNLTHSAGTDEFIAKDIVKPREDSVEEILDSTAYLLAKPLAHDTGSSDSDNKDITKVIGLGESFPYVDATYFAEDYVEISGTNLIVLDDSNFLAVLGRLLGNTASVADVVQIDYQSNITDATISTSDSATSITTKNLSHSSTPSDSDYTVSGSLNYFINFATASDAAVISYLDKYSEIEQVTDSGSIFLSDYADYTYFAEDYVGTTLHTF